MARNHRRAGARLAVGIAVVVATIGMTLTSAGAVRVYPTATYGQGGGSGFYASSVTQNFEFHVSGYAAYSGDTEEFLQTATCALDGQTVYEHPTSENKRAFPQGTTVNVLVEGTGEHQISCETTSWKRKTANCVFCFSGEWYVDYDSAYRVVRIDTNAPTVTRTADRAPDHNGWYNAPVTMRWHGTDDFSGIASCSAPVNVTELNFWYVSGTCTDRAGNQGYNRDAIMFDSTAPYLRGEIDGPVVLGSTASVDLVTYDYNSRVEAATCDPVDTSTIGAKTVVCRATDHAGNSASVAVPYDVVYAFGGFAAPINQSETNVVNAGRSLPLKFSLADANGRPATNLSMVTVRAVTESCDAGVTDDLPAESWEGKALTNHGNGSYHVNWKTPKSYAGSCKRVLVDFGGGGSQVLSLRFT